MRPHRNIIKELISHNQPELWHGEKITINGDIMPVVKTDCGTGAVRLRAGELIINHFNLLQIC